jgi:hypothetical protein
MARPPKQKQFEESVAVATEPEVGIVPEQPRSRIGGAIKRPRFFDDIQVYRIMESTTAAATSCQAVRANVFTWRCSATEVMVMM